MQDFTKISVIIPFFNAENYVEDCLESLKKQTSNQNFEIIMIDDGSVDNTLNKINKFKSLNIKILKNKINLGPSASRNHGIRFAKGDYVFFLDADDKLDLNTFEEFEKILADAKTDIVFSDRKRILNKQNLRENIYEYNHDKTICNFEIIELMEKRFFNPHKTHRIFDLTGKLIKRELLTRNNIFFDENLRYLEDECFIWEILSHVSEIKYLRKQFYTYNIRPNESSGISEAFGTNYELSNFFKVQTQIKKSLYKKGLQNWKIEKISNQALIYIIIGALISLTRSIIIRKIDKNKGKKNLSGLINKIIKNNEICKLAKNYLPYKDESRWIPRAIIFKSSILLYYFCKKRAKEILKKRKN